MQDLPQEVRKVIVRFDELCVLAREIRHQLSLRREDLAGQLGLSCMTVNRHVQASTEILGDLTSQANIKGSASITEPLQLALGSRAVRALVPVSSKTQFAGLPEDVIERLDVVFCGDVERAVLKTLET